MDPTLHLGLAVWGEVCWTLSAWLPVMSVHFACAACTPSPGSGNQRISVCRPSSVASSLKYPTPEKAHTASPTPKKLLAFNPELPLVRKNILQCRYQCPVAAALRADSQLSITNLAFNPSKIDWPNSAGRSMNNLRSDIDCIGCGSTEACLAPYLSSPFAVALLRRNGTAFVATGGSKLAATDKNTNPKKRYVDSQSAFCVGWRKLIPMTQSISPSVSASVSGDPWPSLGGVKDDANPELSPPWPPAAARRAVTSI
ncbi:hypothetical protein DFH06DRAFT_1295941 [Mycena polygramma]|nr:hypothetical protein DFH06DRAFT_1295941 [Mycena polygramma]